MFPGLYNGYVLASSSICRVHFSNKFKAVLKIMTCYTGAGPGMEGGGNLGAEAPTPHSLLGNMLNIIMNFTVYMITNNTNTH